MLFVPDEKSRLVSSRACVYVDQSLAPESVEVSDVTLFGIALQPFSVVEIQPRSSNFGLLNQAIFNS
jgi:hypothetical protein